MLGATESESFLDREPRRNVAGISAEVLRFIQRCAGRGGAVRPTEWRMVVVLLVCWGSLSACSCRFCFPEVFGWKGASIFYYYLSSTVLSVYDSINTFVYTHSPTLFPLPCALSFTQLDMCAAVNVCNIFFGDRAPQTGACRHANTVCMSPISLMKHDQCHEDQESM